MTEVKRRGYSVSRTGLPAFIRWLRGQESPPTEQFQGPPSRVRIVRSPEGPAPKWVRQSWVGIEVNSAYGVPARDNQEYDYTTGKMRRKRRDGIAVRSSDALEALGIRSVDAARWFPNNTSRMPLWLRFGADEVSVVPE